MDNDNTHDAGAKLGAFKALLVLLFVIVAIVIYGGLGMAIGLTSLYGGFLFSLYWAGIKGGSTKEYWPAVIGASGGLVLAWLVYALPIQYGHAGLGIALVLVSLAVYAMIMGWVPILINFSFMLYLSVGTIPPLQTEAEIKGMALSMLFGAALLGAGVLLFTRIGKSRTAATA